MVACGRRRACVEFILGSLVKCTSSYFAGANCDPQCPRLLRNGRGRQAMPSPMITRKHDRLTQPTHAPEMLCRGVPSPRKLRWLDLTQRRLGKRSGSGSNSWYGCRRLRDLTTGDNSPTPRSRQSACLSLDFTSAMRSGRDYAVACQVAQARW